MYITADEFRLQLESEAAPLSFDEFMICYQQKESERQTHFKRKMPKRCQDPECVRVSYANV